MVASPEGIFHPGSERGRAPVPSACQRLSAKRASANEANNVPFNNASRRRSLKLSMKGALHGPCPAQMWGHRPKQSHQTALINLSNESSGESNFLDA